MKEKVVLLIIHSGGITISIEPYKGIAGIYEEIRPSYPDKLIQDIILHTGLKLDDNTLEIGAGTGKATVLFADKGYRIHAVELGEDMAEILRVKCSNFYNITIEVASFEEWLCKEEQKFDLIYSAQAFHWLSKDIKYHKCSQLLKDKGYLALFWYNPSGHKLPTTRSIEEKVNNVVRKYTSKYTSDKGTSERLAHSGVSDDEERKKEIEESGLFHIIYKFDYTHQIRNCADQYLKAMKSVPSFASILDGLDAKTIARMDHEIEQIINNHGGFVEEEFHYSLYIAQKK